MTIIEKIKQSVEGATGMPFLYHAAGELNELIARCNSLPIAYSFLIDSGTIDDVNGRYHERVTIAVMFCDKTEFDFNALENEEIIDQMKVKAYKWLQSLRMSNTLRIVSINSTQRLYDNTTDVLTGFAVNITIDDLVGVGECELPEVVFEIKKNGEYPVVGIDKVMVSVPNSLTDIVVTENGKEYLPADYGVYGFGSVKTEIPKVKVSQFKVTGACINDDGIWEGEKFIDTSECDKLSGNFRSNEKIKTLNASGWNVRKVTDISSFVSGCTNLEYIDLSGWETDSLVNMTYPFSSTAIKEFNFGDLNTSNVTSMFQVFYQCRNLKKCNVTNWDVSKVTDMRYMFSATKIQSLDLTNWEVNSKVNMQNIFWRSSSLVSIVGDRTIENVLENNISVLRNCKFGLVLDETSLDRASLRAVINGLADLTGQTAQTLTLGAKLLAKLTEEDIDIATSKNWTII